MSITLWLELRCNNDDCIVAGNYTGDDKDDCIVQAVIDHWIIDEKKGKAYCSKHCAKEAKKNDR